MCYFNSFDKVLEGNFNNDFNGLVSSSARFDHYQGIPSRIVEIDRRTKVEPTYVTPVKEPVDDIGFEVINLDEEMERRRKSTEMNNPVHTETTTNDFGKTKPMTPKPSLAKTPSRGALLQASKGQTPEVEITFHGNRSQRKAAAAIHRRGAKKKHSAPRKASDPNNSSTQTKSGPTVIDLSTLAFGFGMD